MTGTASARALTVLLFVGALLGCGATKSVDLESLKKDLPPGKETTAAELTKTYGKPFRRISADHAHAAFKEEMATAWKAFGGATEENKAESRWDKTVETWWYELERGYGRVDFEVMSDAKLKVIKVESEGQIDMKLRAYEKKL